MFAVLWIGGVILAAPPGGNYSAKDLHDFTASGHRSAVIIGLIVSLLGVLGLALLLSYLLRSSGAGDVATLLGIVSLVGFALGSVVIDAVPMGLANGGRAIPGPEVYMFTQLGFALAWGVGGTFLGLTLLLLAVPRGVELPSWLRYLTIAAGVLAVASLAFFPFFLLPIWALAAGIWLLLSSRRRSVVATA
jgi:hypothetical protein